MKNRIFKKMYPFIFDEEGNVRKELQGDTCVPSLHQEILTEEILGETPCDDSYSWSGGGHCDYNFFFVLELESLKISQLSNNSTWANGSGERGSSSGAKTVGEQLEGRSNFDLLISVRYRDTDDNGNGEAAKSLTVYREDSQKTKKYLLRLLKEAYLQLREELAT